MAGWDPVETTGLLDKADIKVTKATFNYDATYNNGEQLLFILEGTSDHPDYPEFTQFFSIGKGWEQVGRGEAVEGSLEGFHKQTQYWRFIEGALECGAGEVLQARGTPDKAEIWLGLEFHVERKDVDYGGNIGVKQVLVPTAFLGDGSGKAEAPTSNQATGAAETAAPANGGSTSNVALRAKVKGLLANAASHDDFIEKVIETYPEVQEDADLFAEVVDANGLYAAK